MVSFLFFSGYFFSSDILFFLTCFLYKTMFLFIFVFLCVCALCNNKKTRLGAVRLSSIVPRLSSPVYRSSSLVKNKK
jgi:hypothetical protein